MYKELDQLVLRAKRGDVESKGEILKRLKGLVINSVKRYYNVSNEYDDLLQEGNLIILECIDSYDENLGVYFLGYIKTRLKYNYLDKHKERKHISLNTDSGNEDHNELVDLLESEEPNPLEEYLEIEKVSQLQEKLSNLTDRQKEIILYFYYENMSIGDIAKKLGISYRTVVNTKTRAIEKLRGI